MKDSITRVSENSKSEDYKMVAGGGAHTLKLCSEVMAERWAKTTGGTSQEFMHAMRKQLHAENDTPESLDSKYVDALKKEESRRHGSDAAERLMEEATEAWQCK
jgi:hypothetical protein